VGCTTGPVLKTGWATGPVPLLGERNGRGDLRAGVSAEPGLTRRPACKPSVSPLYELRKTAFGFRKTAPLRD
jgi:hypothetical protein